MKKASKREPEDTMRSEYDFSGGVRGKYAKRFAKGTNIVVLDPDVARIAIHWMLRRKRTVIAGIVNKLNGIFLTWALARLRKPIVFDLFKKEYRAA